MRRSWGLALGLLVLGAAPAFAAQDSQPTYGPPDEEPVVLDLTLPPSEEDRDDLAIRQCEDEADAARIAGEIVVCRSLGEGSDGAYDADDFTRRYGEATQGPKAPSVDGTGVQLPVEGSVATITVTAKFGDPPPPPLIIDIEALPEAPPGSDADRAARGLPPLED